MSEPIKTILTNLKPKEEKKERTQEKTVQSINNIKIDNHNSISNLLILFAVLFFLLISITNVKSFLPSSCTPISTHNTATVFVKISNTQADEIKKLVKIVSMCQNKSPVTVHNELKKIFKYYSYRDIDLSTYDKIVAYLKNQTCH